MHVEVYNVTVKPMIVEVLAGYKRKVFAYDMTGSGKMFTMMGKNPLQSENCNIYAGIIPWMLVTLFDVMQTEENNYLVFVSYV